MAAETVAVPCRDCSTPRPVRTNAPRPPRAGLAAASRRAAVAQRRRQGRHRPARPAPATTEPNGDAPPPGPWCVPRGSRRRRGPRRAGRGRGPRSDDQVGARHRLEVQPLAVLREVRRGAAARVDDHEATTPADVREVCDGGRHRLGEVAAEQEHRIGAAEVGQREGQAAVDAEGPVGGCRGAAHAEPAVVVDVRRAEGNAGELAQLVSLFVGEPAPAEHGHGVGSVPLRGCGSSRSATRSRASSQLGRHQVAVGAAHQGGGEPVGRRQHLGAGPALLAQPAPVRGEVPALDGDAVGTVEAGGGGEGLGALQRAVRAVRWRRLECCHRCAADSGGVAGDGGHEGVPAQIVSAARAEPRRAYTAYVVMAMRGRRDEHPQRRDERAVGRLGHGEPARDEEAAVGADGAGDPDAPGGGLAGEWAGVRR